MKRFIRIISLALVLATVLTTTAYAAESAAPKASSYFFRSSTYLYKTSSTQFQVWFEITATGTMQKLGAKTVKVQRSSDGVNWTTMKTYNSTDYSNMIVTNDFAHTSYFTYSGTPGYQYRAFVTYYAKNSSGTGEVDEYSETLIL